MPETERLPGSSEVLESIIGKYKTMQGEQGQLGATSMLLAIGAFVGRLTVGGIRTALQTIQGAALGRWEQTNLGSTFQSQRKQAFPSPKRGIKTGSNQLALTANAEHASPDPFSEDTIAATPSAVDFRGHGRHHTACIEATIHARGYRI